jgi:CRP-like cAMP-binding protein
VSRIQQVIDTLEAERADLQERLAWLEQQIKEFHAHDGDSAPATPGAPARSLRRGTARRARRATARTRQVDIKPRIVGFLAEHPGSTAGDVAKGLDLNRGSVSTRLSQLAKSGEIKKAARGYTAK